MGNNLKGYEIIFNNGQLYTISCTFKSNCQKNMTTSENMYILMNFNKKKQVTHFSHNNKCFVYTGDFL